MFLVSPPHISPLLLSLSSSIHPSIHPPTHLATPPTSTPHPAPAPAPPPQERIKEETATLTRRRDGLLSYVGRINAFDSKAPGGPLEAYEIKDVIARGQYSYFQVCVHRDSLQQFVLKTTPLPEPFDAARFDEEYRFLSALAHPNLLALHACHLPPKSGRLQLLLEPAPHGNALEFIAARQLSSGA
jgi:hypothetical protein